MPKRTQHFPLERMPSRGFIPTTVFTVQQGKQKLSPKMEANWLFYTEQAHNGAKMTSVNMKGGLRFDCVL